MYTVILSFITAFVVTYVAIPSIIHIARVKKLTDEPGSRRSHSHSTPSLGGIGIFAAVIFSVVMWTPFRVFGDLQYILCSMIILFLVGAKDDILPMNPRKKFLSQLIAAGILVLLADVQIPSFFGAFGLDDIPLWFNYIISIFTILVIINAFNLIDGIDTLSSSITILICAFFGSWFLAIGRIELAILAFTMVGSLVAFLKFNWTPARIFMGDTGSMLCGMVVATLAIEFIKIHALDVNLGVYRFHSVPAVTIGILVIPLFDTLRVFIMRALKGRSPFYPDRSHIHHLLIDAGLSHVKASMFLVFINIFFIVLVYFLQDIGTLNLTFVLLAIAVIGTLILEKIVKGKRVKVQEMEKSKL